jgi:hypothetical protein
MRKVSRHHSSPRKTRQRLSDLLGERRKLATRIAKLDAEVARIAAPQNGHKKPSVVEFDRWLDELTQGLSSLPLLPADFSRADLYDDHD